MLFLASLTRTVPLLLGLGDGGASFPKPSVRPKLDLPIRTWWSGRSRSRSSTTTDLPRQRSARGTARPTRSAGRSSTRPASTRVGPTRSRFTCLGRGTRRSGTSPRCPGSTTSPRWHGWATPRWLFTCCEKDSLTDPWHGRVHWDGCGPGPAGGRTAACRLLHEGRSCRAGAMTEHTR